MNKLTSLEDTLVCNIAYWMTRKVAPKRRQNVAPKSMPKCGAKKCAKKCSEMLHQNVASKCGDKLVDRSTQLTHVSDNYLSTDKYKDIAG